MHQIVKLVEYRCGMLGAGKKPDDLPQKSWKDKEIPAGFRAALHEEGLLDLGGVYGDPDAGDPVEYDNLRLILDDRSIEITVFNRGITLLTSNDREVTSIHRVLSKLID